MCFFFQNDSEHTIMTSGSNMIILLLFLSISHNGLAITRYPVLEKHLLMQLGLSQRPVINKDVHIPSATMELYKSMQEENTITTNFPLPGLHTKSANIVRTYINKGSVPNNPKSRRYRLQFDINPLPEQERVKAAEVRFTVIYNTELQRDEFIHVLIHDIIFPGTKGISKPMLRVLDSKSINVSKTLKSKVISFDVTPALERLSENNYTDNFGMVVQCMSRNRTHLFDVFDFDSTEKPLLMVYTDDGTNKKKASESMEKQRSKRSVDETPAPAPASHKATKKKICQRYPLYVDFKDVGFDDWIQLPSGYQAYYCHGSCPFPMSDHMNASNHAVVQTIMNSVNPKAVPKPCCVPTKLSNQQLLYLDGDNNPVFKSYPDMIIDECGCR